MIFSFVLSSINQLSILNQIKLVNSGKHNFQIYQYKNVNKKIRIEIIQKKNYMLFLMHTIQQLL